MRKTTLVIGAGASKAFGLPLGAELRQQIARDLKIKFDEFGQRLICGSSEIVDALRHMVMQPNGRPGNINPHRAAAVEISDAMELSSSIDEYIERHSGNTLKSDCAKLAISKAILEAERGSSLYVESSNVAERPLHSSANSWIALFLRDATRGYVVSNVADAFERLTVINFNYDRCFEHFAYLWLQQVYGLDASEAAGIVMSLCIHHPYGRLGPLPWEDSSKGVAYGGRLATQRLLNMSRRIKTYSEAMDEDNGLAEVRSRMEDSPNIVFLGFGFHRQNVELLKIPEDKNRISTLRCYATRMGVSEPRWGVMRNRLKHALAIPAHRELNIEGFNGSCEDFWEEYSDLILI